MPPLITPNLKGVPETMLWALYNRAAEARRPDALIGDPLAIQIADAIRYDYVRSFGRPESGQVIRALLSDQLLRAWLQDHPGGQVVALGEGLETRFHRVDDGRVHWLAVDLPEAIAVRSLFLPNSDRHRNLACSALDLRWMDAVDPRQGVIVIAVGLLKYFYPQEVRRLIAAIAGRYPTVEMVFGVGFDLWGEWQYNVSGVWRTIEDASRLCTARGAAEAAGPPRRGYDSISPPRRQGFDLG